MDPSPVSLGPFSLLTSHKDLSLDLGYTLIQDGFPYGAEVKGSACNAGDLGLIPGSEKSPGEGNGNPLQYSLPGKFMDVGVW